jgi:aminocarboxymuconate-semialdehyde decarboxylase
MSELRRDKVEVHSHVVPQEAWGQAGPYGPEMIVDEHGAFSIRVGTWQITGGALSEPPSATMYDPAVRIAEMDEAGIDVMGVSPSPLWFLYHAEPEIAVPWARLNNDLLAKFCSWSPQRLFFMASLPLQDISASLEELQRATGSLGARAVNVGTDDIAGRNLDDEWFDPIWARLSELDLPVFLHPAPLGQADAGFDAAEQRRRDRLGLSWSAGYIYRETMAVCALIYGGVFDRYPNLRVCVPHGGGFVPFQIGRFNWYGERSRAVRNERPFEEYLRHFYFDTVVHDARARKYLCDIVGPDNLIVGSNWAGWDWVDGFAYAQDMTDDDDALRKIWSGNATRLFKLEGFGREPQETA